MRFQRIYLLLLTPFLIATNFQKIASEFVVDLKDPEYMDGMISTTQGGVITAPKLRIQARKIKYANTIIDKKNVHRVDAEGDLMVEWNDKVFVGEKLEYDFITRTGVIYQGKTAVGLWYIGGEKIILEEDQTYHISHAFVTTSENVDREWEIHARKFKYLPKNLLQAEDVSFRFANIPIFYLPYLKSELKQVTDTPVRYSLIWRAGQDPKLSMRYRVYSSEIFDLFTRIDLRTKRGFGGAVETDFHHPNQRSRFLTKNYLAHDTFYNDTDTNQKRTRYRLQGKYQDHAKNNKTSVKLIYDKISDKNMPGNFTSDNFELNTAKRTEFTLRHREENSKLGLYVRPRINSFQGFKQELPTFSFSLRPFQVGQTGIYAENRMRVSYLDYSYADGMQRFISDFHAARLETHHDIYRPIHLGFMDITPSGGFIGIFYNNNPENSPKGQAVFSYGLDVRTPLYKPYKGFSHYFEPYTSFKGLSSPTASISDHFIFDLSDGLNRINQLKVGVQQRFYFKDSPLFCPNIYLDLYAYSFFGTATLNKAIPKLGLNFNWDLSTLSFTSLFGWNFENQVLDVADLHLKWTISADAALSFQYRHRSRFYWRKDDRDNFILDVSRKIPELLDSPLSDERNTFLTRLQFKLAPDWVLRLESHQGWGRAKEPSYHEGRLNLLTMISSGWRMELSLKQNVRGPGFGFSLKLKKNL